MITVEEVNTYLKVKDALYYLCDKWAKNNLEDWQHYSGFRIDGDNITIEYTYQDFWSNTEMYTEYDSIKVPIKEILQ
jgi:hypothetical protein